MSVEPERVYVINLGKVLLSQPQHRAVRAINMIREFARRHMKENNIKIDESLAQLIWSKGARRPPRKIRVRMSKIENGYVHVSSYDALDDIVDDVSNKDEKDIPASSLESNTESLPEPPKEDSELVANNVKQDVTDLELDPATQTESEKDTDELKPITQTESEKDTDELKPITQTESEKDTDELKPITQTESEKDT